VQAVTRGSSQALDVPVSHRHPFAFIQQAARTRSNSLEMPSVALHAMNVRSCIHYRKFRIKRQWEWAAGGFEKSAGRGIFCKIRFACFKYIYIQYV